MQLEELGWFCRQGRMLLQSNSLSFFNKMFQYLWGVFVGFICVLV